ncbi:class I SAM-dependent methyltransferase [Citreimonas salinaria]|uniref:SAM-dependent methyltransferase, MidA family n=1 Tax=Citreimonas salinaria TaxID=321339 RepID=A0A1H3LT01_9RHOB|nr:SAM-dependent methyltransferase [Citreimonas salinaria]SDY67493.1 SAM-dependent methyltransferase, MidA family [Citreimonas salinaria]
MTPLAALLVRQIAATGPISLAEYMAACLGHPEHGYYTTRDPLGAQGDFTTAPEISQLFGEMLGLTLAQAWIDHGRPASFTLAELGPGRGTLMADALRVTRAVPGFREAAQLHLVETSSPLRAVQAATLDAVPTWHDSVETLPDAPLFLIANEFFDALPIRQFQRVGDGWAERMIGLDGDRLVIGQSSAAPVAALEHRLADTPDGGIVETRAPAAAIASELGARIASRGGAALIVDYGDWRSRGDTLQAVAGHAPIDPFATPGQADLTAHVDFEALALAAAPARATPLIPQGVFLERLGITERARSLASGGDAAQVDAIAAAHRRLTHPDEMGSVFRILGLAPADAPALPGLDP